MRVHYSFHIIAACLPLAAMGQKVEMTRKTRRSRLIDAPITESELRQCEINLWATTNNDKQIDTIVYLDFLKRQSNDRIVGDSFQKLPLSLVHVYWTSLCAISIPICTSGHVSTWRLINEDDGKIARYFCSNINQYVRDNFGPITPTLSPTNIPTIEPSKQPTLSPPSPTPKPSKSPTKSPSSTPSSRPSKARPPTLPPTSSPTKTPSSNPTSQPSILPSISPTRSPSSIPSNKPSKSPSRSPTSIPSKKPTNTPSTSPSFNPSSKPSNRPSRAPSSYPTSLPSHVPTSIPSSRPSTRPSASPSHKPSTSPTSSPTTSSPTSIRVIVGYITTTEYNISNAPDVLRAALLEIANNAVECIQRSRGLRGSSNQETPFDESKETREQVDRRSRFLQSCRSFSAEIKSYDPITVDKAFCPNFTNSPWAKCLFVDVSFSISDGASISPVEDLKIRKNVSTDIDEAFDDGTIFNLLNN